MNIQIHVYIYILFFQKQFQEKRSMESKRPGCK